MKYIVTYSGMNFNLKYPDISMIKIEDIAHSLSMICIANGHIKQFFSVAQHSINCATEAKLRGFSKKIQLACLLHDAKKAYVSDIALNVKSLLDDYSVIEQHLQDLIYKKFLHDSLTLDEYAIVKKIYDDILVCELNALMNKFTFEQTPAIKNELHFDFKLFSEIENEFVCLFYDKSNSHKTENIKSHINRLENELTNRSKLEVENILNENNITNALFEGKQEIKKLSAQIDVLIHAYGILLTLPKILNENEKILSLSLGAGNTGKNFDLETTDRVAEYKFVNWTGKSDTIRENNLFKDFVELAVTKTDKKKYIYCYNLDIVKRFLLCKRSLDSVLHKSSFKEKFNHNYGNNYKTVGDFYNDFKDEVSLVDLQNLL